MAILVRRLPLMLLALTTVTMVLLSSVFVLLGVPGKVLIFTGFAGLVTAHAASRSLLRRSVDRPLTLLEDLSQRITNRQLDWRVDTSTPPQLMGRPQVYGPLARILSDLLGRCQHLNRRYQSFCDIAREARGQITTRSLSRASVVAFDHWQRRALSSWRFAPASLAPDRTRGLAKSPPPPLTLASSPSLVLFAAMAGDGMVRMIVLARVPELMIPGLSASAATGLLLGLPLLLAALAAPILAHALPTRPTPRLAAAVIAMVALITPLMLVSPTLTTVLAVRTLSLVGLMAVLLIYHRYRPGFMICGSISGLLTGMAFAQALLLAGWGDILALINGLCFLAATACAWLSPLTTTRAHSPPKMELRALQALAVGGWLLFPHLGVLWGGSLVIVYLLLVCLTNEATPRGAVAVRLTATLFAGTLLLFMGLRDLIPIASPALTPFGFGLLALAVALMTYGENAPRTKADTLRRPAQKQDKKGDTKDGKNTMPVRCFLPDGLIGLGAIMLGLPVSASLTGDLTMGFGSVLLLTGAVFLVVVLRQDRYR
ncbi:MAG: hypothetical protein AAF442_03885 [Pseudomonadota bacterium]